MSEPESPAPARRPWPGLAVVSLVLANLVPLAGVFAFHWDAAMIILLYWVENLVVGFYKFIVFGGAQGAKSQILSFMLFRQILFGEGFLYSVFKF